MKWSETIASTCRYGEIAGRIFEKAEIIWEKSESDYQGSANILAFMPDKTFIHYEWTYGSCSGCDEWEARGLTDDQVEEEMRKTMAVLKGKCALVKYLKLEGEYEHARVPTAQSPTAGSIPGMLRYLGGGIATEFKEMGEVVMRWIENNKKEK